jgi:hypothetical protein
LVRWDAGTIHESLTAIRFEFAKRSSATTGEEPKELRKSEREWHSSRYSRKIGLRPPIRHAGGVVADGHRVVDVPDVPKRHPAFRESRAGEDTMFVTARTR